MQKKKNTRSVSDVTTLITVEQRLENKIIDTNPNGFCSFFFAFFLFVNQSALQLQSCLIFCRHNGSREWYGRKKKEKKKRFERRTINSSKKLNEGILVPFCQRSEYHHIMKLFVVVQKTTHNDLKDVRGNTMSRQKIKNNGKIVQFDLFCTLREYKKKQLCLEINDQSVFHLLRFFLFFLSFSFFQLVFVT